MYVLDNTDVILNLTTGMGGDLDLLDKEKIHLEFGPLNGYGKCYGKNCKCGTVTYQKYVH